MIFLSVFSYLNSSVFRIVRKLQLILITQVLQRQVSNSRKSKKSLFRKIVHVRLCSTVEQLFELFKENCHVVMTFSKSNFVFPLPSSSASSPTEFLKPNHVKGHQICGRTCRFSSGSTHPEKK